MVEQTKAARVRRVSVESVSFGAHGKILGAFIVNGERIEFDAVPDSTILKMIAYGTTQLVNDALAGEDDKEAALAAVILRLKSGDWAVTRGGAKAETIASVAADMVRANAKAKGVKVTAEDVKTLVAKILANPDGVSYGKVKTEFDRRQQVEELDLGDL